jgi:hypothetical protein
MTSYQKPFHLNGQNYEKRSLDFLSSAQSQNRLRQFKSEVQQVLMAENKILRKAFDSNGRLG